MRQGLGIAFVSCSVSLQSKAEGTQYSPPLVLFVAVNREGDTGITELASDIPCHAVQSNVHAIYRTKRHSYG